MRNPHSEVLLITYMTSSTYGGHRVVSATSSSVLDSKLILKIFDLLPVHVLCKKKLILKIYGSVQSAQAG